MQNSTKDDESSFYVRSRRLELPRTNRPQRPQRCASTIPPRPPQLEHSMVLVACHCVLVKVFSFATYM